MPRRFVLQLDLGQVPGEVRKKVVKLPARPLWRCSGCLVRRTVAIGGPLRPMGRGCESRSCKGAVWIPDNRWAVELDKEAEKDPRPAIQHRPSAMQLAVCDIVEQAIADGEWARLTPSCRPHIENAVHDALTQEFRPERPESAWRLDFDYNLAILTLDVWIDGYAASVRDAPTFVVRFRWFQ